MHLIIWGTIHFVVNLSEVDNQNILYDQIHTINYVADCRISAKAVFQSFIFCYIR